LGLDTTGAACSAAIFKGGRIVAREFAAMARGHAEALMPMVQAVMHAAGLGYDALDLIAATVGPGSYTGVRVGLATAQGLATATGKPLSGITSFEAVMARMEPGRQVLVAIDSKRAEDVYAQSFGADGAPRSAPAAVADATLVDLVDGRMPVLVAGDAAPRAISALTRVGVTALSAAAPRLIDAAAIAALTAELWLKEGTPRAAAPLYLRAADARTPAERRALTSAPAKLVDAGIVHAAVIAALQQRAFDEAWSTEAVASLLAQIGTFGLLLVLPEADNLPVGYCLVRQAADEAEILSLAVHPQQRRRGLGKRLVIESKARATQAGAKMLHLEVAQSNRAARILYESHGFRETGRRRDYYRGARGSEDAITYACELSLEQPKSRSQ
jgi:tRNA threonylcarbamoyladenosine biosynthesis protein TsaB